MRVSDVVFSKSISIELTSLCNSQDIVTFQDSRNGVLLDWSWSAILSELDVLLDNGMQSGVLKL
jgi:hypothetical protein